MVARVVSVDPKDRQQICKRLQPWGVIIEKYSTSFDNEATGGSASGAGHQNSLQTIAKSLWINQYANQLNPEGALAIVGSEIVADPDGPIDALILAVSTIANNSGSSNCLIAEFPGTTNH